MASHKIIQTAEQWFHKRGWMPKAFQKQTWKSYLDGYHGLLNAPTGSGKTYALWIPVALEIAQRNDYDEEKIRKAGLQALWITPLRALSKEILKATSEFCAENDLPIEVGIRTGDTSQSVRARQKRQMPALLITTPESLHLLLAQKGYPALFKNLKAVIVDEWHEVIGSKRGVQVELALSRLKNIATDMRIWGVSATIGNLEEASDVLFGNEKERMETVLLRSNLRKKIQVLSILPDEVERMPWAGHLGIKLMEKVIPVIRKSRTTLLFTNTRSQTEIWFQKIHEAAPDLGGLIAMHHGSLSREVREWVEEALRQERLKAVICTSSLDLGVDFSPVETVIQIGSPKGVARFMQRAGRSGHQPGAVSRIYFLPTHALELIEAAGLREAVNEGKIEARKPYFRSFDVLVQYLVTLAVSDGFHPEEILKEIRTTFSYETISDEEWQWVMNFITLGSQSLYAYDEFKKVVMDEAGLFRVMNRRTAMHHRMSIGTIVSDSMLEVKYLQGGRLGHIEEWFISKLKPGDIFWFAGRSLELYRIQDMKVLVRRSNEKTGRIPAWLGGRMPLSSQMSKMLRDKLSEASSMKSKDPELRMLKPLLDLQKLRSEIPSEKEFLMETCKTREGYHVFFYPFEGRYVHEAMSSLFAYRISRLKPISFSLAYNDYGFELLSDQPVPLQEAIEKGLFSTEDLLDDLHLSINASEMARRKFRDIAVIAGLVFPGYPGQPKSAKHLQSSAQLFFDVFKDYEEDNLLYLQSFRETFENQIEEERLREALNRIKEQKHIIRKTDKPSPFSFPILVDGLREKLTSEKLEDRIKKMVVQFIK
jgi:ATP-dependent Lhr-like helicase